MTLALLMAPLVLAMGTAIDYGYAMSVRTEMQSAADIAAVQALSEQSAGVIAALTQSLSGKLELAETDAGHLFEANLQEKSKDYLDSKEINIVRTGNTFVSTVGFQATVPTSFLGMFGVRKIDVSGVAKATYVPAKYIDFHLMLDNSPSMGLGATTADIANLINATKNNAADASCAFACHVDDGKNNDYYSLAKKIGVTTRIEMVIKASQTMLETAVKTRRYSDQYRMALYSLGKKAKDAGLTKVADLSDELDKLEDEAGKIELMSIPSHKEPNMQTDLVGSLTELEKIIGKAGTGQNSADRQKVLFLVSDGLEDTKRPTTCLKKVMTGGTNEGRCQAPMNESICQTIRDNGVTIAVLYTTYQPIDNNGHYNKWIKPFRAEIPTRMKNCASEGLFFEVSPSQGIEEAMNALFLKVVNMPRLTQ